MRCAALLSDPEQVEHQTSTDAGGQRKGRGIDIHWLARMRRIAPPRSRAELRVPCKKHKAVPQRRPTPFGPSCRRPNRQPVRSSGGRVEATTELEWAA